MEVAVDDDEDLPAAAPLRRRPAKPDRKKAILWVSLSLGALVVLLVVLGMAWGPMQRSSQLAALDDCRTGDRIEESRRLARVFADTWGPRSQHVVNAITTGRGPIEARIELCRAGKHLRLLADMLRDDRLEPAQRGLVCAALIDVWPEDGSGPGMPPSLPAWALDPDSPPALADPALRLMVAAADKDAVARLSQAAADARLPPDRALAAAFGLARVIERRSEGVTLLLSALRGAHRAALLESQQVRDAVRDQALSNDVPALLALLDTPDSALLGLSGLSGKRVALAAGDEAQRRTVASKLEPFLTTGTDDAQLAQALLVVHRHRLIESHAQVLALLPRLARNRPQGLPADDLAELLGRSLVHTGSPAAAAAAEAMIMGYTAALDRDETLILAAVALSRVQEAVPVLRLALDSLAARSGTPVCADALTILVGNVYKREDVVAAARRRGWSPVMADDRRRRARVEAIQRWLADHAEETTVRTEKEVLVANQAELGRMRDEIRVWLESSEPPPIGFTKAGIEELANRVQLQLNMTTKAQGM